MVKSKAGCVVTETGIMEGSERGGWSSDSLISEEKQELTEDRWGWII